MIQNFWLWLYMPRKGKRRKLTQLFDRWIFVHSAIALILNIFLNANPFEFASKALFPAASILVGMAVAWTSRAATILQDKNFRNKVIDENNPIEDYVYGYQFALLIIMSAVIYVSIMASGGFNFVIYNTEFSIFISGFWMYLLLSMAIRECWGVINFSNLLSILNDRVPPDSEK